MFSQAVLQNIPTRNVSSYLKPKVGLFKEDSVIPGYTTFKSMRKGKFKHRTGQYFNSE
jgi:hypothetical protein